MELRLEDKVRYLTHNNKISDEECIIKEICDNGKTVKLKKPNDEIMRIYYDRIRPLNDVDKKTDKADSKAAVKTSTDKKFDPWSEISNGEVWVKQSKFSTSIVMKSFVIINLDNNTYRSVNAYNDKFSNAGVKDYKLDNQKSLESKLEKKGYKKLTRSTK
jgi:hypothetical protein